MLLYARWLCFVLPQLMNDPRILTNSMYFNVCTLIFPRYYLEQGNTERVSGESQEVHPGYKDDLPWSEKEGGQGRHDCIPGGSHQIVRQLS